MKRNKASVSYTNEAAMRSQRCQLCQHFRPPRACRKVAGAISARGWCELWVHYGERVLGAVRPNAGLSALYRKRLLALVDEMNASIEHWLVATYRKHPPRVAKLAQDATPAVQLRRAIREMAQHWEQRFDDMAPRLAEWFATAAATRSRAQLASILRTGGISVRLQMSATQKDVLEAAIAENVSLIKSIPSRHFTQIEGMVMRSVSTGRDLQQLNRDLRREFGVTKRRAALIARDQNNKATAAFTRVRQMELGIKRAVWLHSHAGKEPRPTHVKMDGKTYDTTRGMWDSAEGAYVFPGQLINCRCVSKSIVPGFS